VQARFSKEYSDSTAALAKGQVVTVACTELTEVIGSPILSDCTM
jgi:hypothetical protein